MGKRAQALSNSHFNFLVLQGKTAGSLLDILGGVNYTRLAAVYVYPKFSGANRGWSREVPILIEVTHVHFHRARR